MGSLRRNRRQMSQINMVPFIDIILVLLVAFMIGVPVMQQGVNVSLPKVNSKILPAKENEAIVISIDQKGNFFADIGKKSEKKKSLNQIVELIRKLHINNAEKKVLIRGDKNVSYGKVVDLMAKLQGVNIKNVGLVTVPESNYKKN